MTSTLTDTMSISSPQFVNDSATSTIQNVASANTHSLGVTQNVSVSGECAEVKFSEMEYLPWNNSNNVVSAEVERITFRVRNNVLGLLFLIGGPANVINMAVFYKQGLKDRVNLCLFALSLADELFLIVCMLLLGEQLHLQFTTEGAIGPVETSLVNVNLTGLMGLFSVSPVISAIIALERCYCVFRPLKIQTLMNVKTMAAVIVTVYVVVIGLFFVVAFRYRIGCVYDLDSRLVLKTLVVGDFYRDHKDMIDFLDGIVFGVSLPSIVLITVLTSTIITAVKLRQIVTWRIEASTSLSAREVALTKMLVGNSILFIVCVSPPALIRLIWLFFPEMNAGRRNHNFYMSTMWISLMCNLINASFNIFVYYAMGSRYRETFWALFSRKNKNG